MPETRIIDPLEDGDWHQLLLSTPNYSFFHSPGWARVLCESYKYKPLYFMSIDKGELSVLVPLMQVDGLLRGRRAVSLPFTDHCEPLAQNGSQFSGVLKNIIDYGHKARWNSLELRGGQSFLGDEPASSSYYVHQLPLLQNVEKIFLGFRPGTRRNIKKALRMGVQVEISSSAKSIQQFYRLNCITRKKHGLPPQPYYFFKNFFDHVISKDNGIAVLAFYNSHTIAAGIYCHMGEKALYKWGASDPHYQHLRANNLVMWEAIKWYADKGFESIDFGRTELSNKGLLQFKRGWGATEQMINYYKYDFNKDAFVRNRSKVDLLVPIFKRLPSSLLRMIGNAFYRYAA